MIGTAKAITDDITVVKWERPMTAAILKCAHATADATKENHGFVEKRTCYRGGRDFVCPRRDVPGVLGEHGMSPS